MKKKFLLSAIVSILICLCLMGGATFALFTDKAEINVAITAGDVDIDAKVVGIKTYTETTLIDEGATEADFENGGVATLNGNTVTVDRMTPMDKVVVTILLENHSNVNIKYRTTFTDVTVLGAEDVALFNALEFATQEEGQGVVSIGTGTVTDWSMIKAADQVGTTIKTVDLIIEFPDHGDADNQYKNGVCDLVFAIEAVQGNAPVQVANEEQLVAAIESGEEFVKLTSDVVVSEPIVVGGDVSLNLNGKTVSANYNGADGFQIFDIPAGASLTVTGEGTVSATTKSSENNRSLALFNNNGTLVIKNGTFVLNDTTEGKSWIIATIIDNRTRSKSSNAEVIIEGGEFSVLGKAKNLFRNYPQQGGVATLTIKGGNFNANPDSDLTYIWNQEAGSYVGRLNFLGGTFANGVVYEDYNGQSDVTIADGVIIGAYSGNN